MESKQNIVEKRIKPGIIRRRAKSAPPEATPEEISAAAVEESQVAEAASVEETAKVITEQTPVAAASALEEAVSSRKASEAPATPVAAKTATKEIPAEGAKKVGGPRQLPEGPPVGTIIQLPHMKKKEAEAEAAAKGIAATPTSLVEEEEKKLKAKKGLKKGAGGEEIDLEEISKIGNIAQISKIAPRSLAERVFQPTRTGRKRRSKLKAVHRQEATTLPRASKRIVKMGETILVSDLAQQLGIKGSEIIKKLMQMGSMLTVNQPVDFDTASLIATDYQWEVRKVSFTEENFLKTDEDKPEELLHRAPVVTVMGHVDHGKTSLLDAIRSTEVALGEHGGITQHIGAYQVRLGSDKVVTFLDTPGHEAFTSMRARGASVTDIVILVVAADDGVMPQTIEAIHHAKAAEVPIIVAVNKIDKPGAQPDQVKRQLSEHGLLSEEWGGDTLFAHVSAKAKQGIKELLELVFLQAEVLELKSNPNKLAKGVIVEARLDKGRGPVVTALIQEGTLHLGDYIVVGSHSGRVRAMLNDKLESIQEAGPGVPVEILGLDGVPSPSDSVQALKDEKRAKQIAEHREQKVREQKAAGPGKMSLEDLFSKLQAGEVKELSIILKADVQGSLEALQGSLDKLSTPKVRVQIIHSGVGAITESDVMLASASNAVIIGFHVRPDTKAREIAEREGVEVKVYQVIYDAVENIEKAMEGLLEPTFKEKYLGRAEVRQVFQVSKVGNVAGCFVIDGKIQRGGNARLLRDNVVLFEGKLSSLKRFKDDAREVEKGYECGMSIEGYQDIKPGDVVESYLIESVKTKLNA